MTNTLLVALWLCGGAQAAAHRPLLYGPYMVSASSTSARICWKDASQEDCRTFEGLTPGATFSYSLPGSTAAWVGRALPDLSRPLRIAVFGDSGKGGPNQLQVAKVLETRDPDMAVLPGDIVYPRGEIENYPAKFFTPYAASLSRLPFYPAPGNHDYGFRSAEKGRKRFEESYQRIHRKPAYYSFDAGPAHFVALDDNQAYDIEAAAPIDPGSAQLSWLEEDLAASKALWKIVFLHVPLYSTMLNHGNNAFLRQALEPVFQKHKVDLVLAGHDHIYERSKSLGGVVYVTAGTGGASLYRGLTDLDWLEKQLVAFGLAWIEINGRRLTLEFVDAEGAVRDRFVLDKGRAKKRSSAASSARRRRPRRGP
ncbi:MAG: metallophosphoesterase [Elusimicrobia bacterium]|nr:metallophosphoesterase [Elusimicrobiota bacterium]